jgi:hypothetical protein
VTGVIILLVGLAVGVSSIWHDRLPAGESCCAARAALSADDR